VLINKWTLLICVTLDAGRISAGSKSGLFEFKTAMGIVAIAALHGAFKNLVMERKIKLVLHLAVAAQTKLRLARFQQLERRDAWLLRVRGSDKDVRTGQVFPGRCRMHRVTVCAAYVVTPMFTATEVVMFLTTGMTA
jgi:hypothetical protein